MTPAELFGPWPVEGYDVRIDFARGVRLIAARRGADLRALPPAVRESGEIPWIRVAYDAARKHYRDLKALVENAMVERIPLSGGDLAMLAIDPAGRPLVGGLLLEVEGIVGRPLPDDWLLETLDGDLVRLGAPARVVHPASLHAARTLERWNAWLNRQPFRQPFKQVRRELYLPNAEEREARTFSRRFAGETVRWDQTRALLEGRGWRHVTKTGGQRPFQRERLTAYLEFRTPASRGFSREDVVLGRIFFLPTGENVVNRGSPGLDLDRVPAALFSEALRDAGLVAQVARRRDGTD